MDSVLKHLLTLLFSSLATAFFALSVKSQTKTAVFAGVLGGVGYVTYVLLGFCMSDIGAVFLATLLACLLAECAARPLKTPATVISIPAIIPLVPGVSLYKTLLVFGSGDNTGGATMLVHTLLVAGSMSVAVTMATIIAKMLFKKRR